MSFKACANRFIKLNDHPVAIVFSKDNVIDYGFRSQEIPFWLRARKGDPIPSNSLTQLYSGKPQTIVNEEVDSGTKSPE